MMIDNNSYRLADDRNSVRRYLFVAIAGIFLSLIGLVLDSGLFYQSYLTAFSFWLTISLGCLFFVMLHHLTNATWSVLVRRIAENGMTFLFIAPVLFIPVLIGIPKLYHWSHPELVLHDELLQGKSGFLNVPFFIIRTLIYFAIWFFLSFRLWKLSLAQDSTGSPEITQKMRLVSAIGMLLYAISVTFASFDWLMSLDAHWYSTIFGVYIFGGGLLAALAFITYYSIKFKSAGLDDQLGPNHFHDLGKLVFAFTIFWAYIAFSQYFLIWYGNIPEETYWYHNRWRGAWKFFSLVLVFGSFIVPFIVLISKGAKKNLNVLKAMIILLLVVHWVDIFWIVVPNFRQDGFLTSWIDIAAMLAVGGIFLWYFSRRLSNHPVAPVGDPRLSASIKMGKN